MTVKMKTSPQILLAVSIHTGRGFASISVAVYSTQLANCHRFCHVSWSTCIHGGITCILYGKSNHVDIQWWSPIAASLCPKVDTLLPFTAWIHYSPIMFPSFSPKCQSQQNARIPLTQRHQSSRNVIVDSARNGKRSDVIRFHTVCLNISNSA